ncbi:Qat anti-phage system TatD family nuclease QatD [Specibacter sp. AOP5-B1-6]|uniref:Qat anti-phage system TatD family nuclease QatD n=1 Tax=Specibacter sp. AOP5-B1-6 TaxID=3457653 RepID=UPI003FBA6396
MIDFHCHLDLYPNPSEVADEIQGKGIGVLSVTTTPSAWKGTAQLGEARPAIRTALGLHPQLAGERFHELKIFDRHFDETRFIGEVGLDGSPELRSSWAQQTDVFRHILRACNEAGDKVLSIHSRRAATPVLDLLDDAENVHFPILHWFSGTHAELTRAIARDCWFSVGPAMLAGTKGRALISEIPRNRILLETDGPVAQVRRVSLSPWDITSACSALSTEWGLDYDQTATIIRGNESYLLAGSPASG